MTISLRQVWLVSALLLGFHSSALAVTIRLAWDPSPSSNLAGYVLRYREAGAASWTTLDVGNVTSWAVSNLTNGRTYAFSVAAYDGQGLQSAFTSEVNGVAYVEVTVSGGQLTIPLGQATTWTASDTGFDGNVEYLFRRYSASTGAWTTVRNYSTTRTYSWTPESGDDGRYMIEVWARTVGSGASSESQGSTGYFAVGNATPMFVMPGKADFDGDGRADLSVFRPTNGYWYALLSGSQFSSSLVRSWGTSTDVPVPGDYDGDGRTDMAVFRPSNGTWYVLCSGSQFTTTIVRGWGSSTDIPVPGDYDGDGRTDFAVWRPGNGGWYVLKSDANFTTTVVRSYGLNTDIPVPGDYDGDGRNDLAVFRPSNGTWYVMESISGFTTTVSRGWGTATDKAVPADFDGDHRTDFAVFRPSNGTWYILQSSSGFATVLSRSWGVSTDIPVPADYSGDGTADFAVFRPAVSSTWFVWGQFSRTWGTTGDIPLLMK